ncbi:hypothetical protein CLOM_g22736 [Closterium sp. NIES-68]|nr:hypothetical protein CLOM_g22736 [Closterium sp. NIES-68]GJP60548.1 hypothetical protein CLOP_g17789 [Closterium sp. NIES-67]
MQSLSSLTSPVCPNVARRSTGWSTKPLNAIISDAIPAARSSGSSITGGGGGGVACRSDRLAEYSLAAVSNKRRIPGRFPRALIGRIRAGIAENAEAAVSARVARSAGEGKGDEGSEWGSSRGDSSNSGGSRSGDGGGNGGGGSGSSSRTASSSRSGSSSNRNSNRRRRQKPPHHSDVSVPPSNDDLGSWAALDGKRLMNVLSYRATLAELLAVVKAHRERGEAREGGSEEVSEGGGGGEDRGGEGIGGEGRVGEGKGGLERGTEGSLSPERSKGKNERKASTGLSPVHICTAFHRIAKHAKRMGGGRRFVDQLRQDETVRWLGRQVEALAKGGRLKGQALANVAWAQAELAHGPPTLLNTVMAASLVQVKSFQPLEVAILMHALGSTAGLPSVNPSLARDLVGRLTWQHVIGSLHCYQPRHVKEILWAHARVGLHSHLLFSEAAKLVLTDMSSYSAPQLAIIAWSFAKLHHSDDAFFPALAGWAESNVSAFESQDISNMLWAFARLNVDAPALFSLFVPRVVGSIQEHSTQSLSNIAWAYATAGYRSQQLLVAVGEETTRRIVGGTLERDAMTGQAIANIAWALATQSHYDIPFFSAATAHATRYMPKYAGRTIACMAFAFALIGHAAPPLFRRIESEIIRRLASRPGEQEFGRQALVMLAWALVVHGPTDKPSPSNSASPSAPPSPTATTTISTIVNPSSASSSSPSLSPALPILRHHLLSLTNDLTSSELCQLYQVDLATQLEAPEHNKQLIEAGMDAMRDAGGSAFSRSKSGDESEGSASEGGGSEGSASEGDGEQEEEEEERDESYWYLQHLWLSGFVRQQAKACWEAAHEEEKIQVSGLQRDISTALHHMHLPHTLEYRDGDYSVDIAIFLPLTNGQTTAGALSARGDSCRKGGVLKIAVEADGPSHFTISTSAETAAQPVQQQQQHVPLGPTQLKARLLRCRGWQVVQIPFFEWECLSDLHQKQTYLAARLGPLAMQLALVAADADVADAAKPGVVVSSDTHESDSNREQAQEQAGERAKSSDTPELDGTGGGETGAGGKGTGGTGVGENEGEKLRESKEGVEGEEGVQVGEGGKGGEGDEVKREGEGAEKAEEAEEEAEEGERRVGRDVLKRAEMLGAWKARQGKGGLGADRLALLKKAAIRRGLTQK